MLIGQDTHAVAAAAPANLPAAHWPQLSEPAALLYRPAGQSRHVVERHLPAAQPAHTVDRTSPVVAEEVPEGQAVQPLELGLAWYVFVGQMVQVAAPENEAK